MNIGVNNEQQELYQGAAAQATKRVVKVDSKGRSHGVGRRKSSVAKVWIKPGNGNITINSKKLDEYFSRPVYQADLQKPFKATGALFDVMGTAIGGGKSGQCGAMRLAISRAIVNFNPEFYTDLRNMGLLTVDSRVVERKKCGLVKARKAKPTSRR
jgi:small subunit ribosomal protein S9